MDYSRNHTASFPNKPSIELTSGTAGDGSHSNPEDLLVAAAASCHMLSFLGQCAKHGLTALTYQDHAVGTLEMQNGHLCVTRIDLNPRVQLEEGTDEKLALRMHDLAHEGCYIANSISSEITINPTFVI